MEPGEPKNAAEAKSEKAESAEAEARQDANDEKVQPLVLPIVVVSGDQTEIGETPGEAAPAADRQTANRQQPGEEGDVVRDMSGLLAEVAPEDWEDAAHYDSPQL